MDKKLVSASDALRLVMKTLYESGTECRLDSGRGLVHADGITLAKLAVANPSRFLSERRGYDAIQVEGVDNPRSYTVALRRQKYTANRSTGEWPIEKIVARIQAANVMRESFRSSEAQRRKSAKKQEVEYADAMRATEEADIGAAVTLVLGQSPTLTIEWPNVSPERVFEILKKLSERP